MSLTLLPSPVVSLEIEVEGLDFFNFININDSNTLEVSFSGQQATHSVFSTTRNGNSALFVPSTQPIQIMDPSSHIRDVVFHLFNWPYFWAREHLVVEDELELHAGPWRIRISQTEHTKNLVDTLKRTGGYALTHVGSITRLDGEVFSTADTSEILEGLGYYLTFAMGRRTNLRLAVGHDGLGNVAYAELGLGSDEPGAWNRGCSWFDDRESCLLEDVIGGFWSLREREIWKKPIEDVIYWYSQANLAASSLGVDSALILTQTALELLAWNYCVRDRKMVSAKAFEPRGLNAADKLRLLTSSLGIPLEIPTHLKSLHSKPGKKWVDSMDAITDLRNGLVHPREGQNGLEEMHHDAWRLSMWYLDLILLRLCGHNGKYANRIAEPDGPSVEIVPWMN